MRRIARLMAAVVLVAAPSIQAASATGTTILGLTVGAEASISITTSNTALTSGDTLFSNYAGTTSFTYSIRTAESGGTGSITLQVTSDWTPSTGNLSVANPHDADDLLKYTCTAATGTACATALTASTTAATTVATIGAGAHGENVAGSVTWSLKNDPAYKTGAYSATVTFTIGSA